MPIDISVESPISLTQATAYLPRRRKGRKPAVSTLHRWATVGVRGVRLETIQVGGTKCTSVHALQRFYDRLTDRDSVPVTANREEAERHRHAEVDLRQLWGGRGQ